MLLPSILVLLQLQPLVVEGRGAPAVAVPRLEEDISVDGDLMDAAWQRAVRLTGFHQYQPVDGRPAEERTEVLVFYSPRAIHFGIIAHARNPSAIRATVADRDNIGNDDRVTIYLDTFNDRRRAFFFGVNALGVQQDGVRTEGAVSAGNIFGGSVDYNPDYYFESKGQVTDSGYVVEVRIPFKSLRFPGNEPQHWGVNIVRNVPSTGYEDTWTDARRANASFLAQSGTLEGIERVQRGVVLEAQPFVTATMTGALDAAANDFQRDDPEPDAGLNVRVGLPQLSLDATINPDFSQVESDASLVTVNERFALFLPEKRPFFLEGIELFSTPNQLVYTRRIVNPILGGKVTGKVGRYGVAHLTALDEVEGPDELFNITRVRADFGGSSVAGVTLTDRRQRSASNFNTVAAADSRIVFRTLYYVEGQAGASWTRHADEARSAAIWKAEFDRTGRSWGFNYQVVGLENGFESDAGFVPRTGIVRAHGFNRFTLYGKRGALLENFTTYLGPTGIWNYDDFGRKGTVEGSEGITGIFTFRRGWLVSAGISRRFVTFDTTFFTGLETELPGGDARIAYRPQNTLRSLFADSLVIETPVYQTLNASLGAVRSAVPIFFEGSEGRETRVTGTLSLRPRASVRIEGTGVMSSIKRERDGSRFARTIIPRLKAEYQPSRALFFRVVTEYRSVKRSALLDARTGAPLLSNGTPVPAEESGGLRTDWLASYEPTPGTVAFLGYGTSLESPEANGFDRLHRTADGFFVKLAYQFRR